MPGLRKLWTGPCGASSLDRAIDRSSGEASDLWLVPSKLAKEQVVRRLASRSKGTRPPRVWSWDDAWEAIARAQGDVPARLSASGLMAVLSEAIERALRSGQIDVLSGALERPGYRRQLARQFAAWTLEERRIDGPSPSDSAISHEEWAVFRAYRETLRQVGGEDPEGWAAWASRALAHQPPPELRKPGQVVVIDPIAPDRSAWRLLEYCQRQARSMTVTLPFDPDPNLGELHAGVEEARRRFLEWGFVEEREQVDGLHFRPAGLMAIERELFRTDSHERPKIELEPDQGLKILGGPKGEGVALLIAREVRRFLDRGARPDEILVLVPRVDEEAERIREALRSWEIPAEEGPGGRLSTIPAVSALRLAMRLPVDGWEASSLVRLLRNGQIRLAGLESPPRFGRFEAASAIHATRIFRDRGALVDALKRDREDPLRGRMAKVALGLVARLGQVIDSTAGPGSWPVQVGRARRLADSLGLDPDALGPLWDALDDQGWVLERLGAAIAEESLTWAEFVGRVEGTIAEVVAPSPAQAPGSIRVASVRDAEGAHARLVILANLAERTFPAADSIDLDESSEALGRPGMAYSREMLRFASVSGSADERLVLAYPTTDANGEALLAAGFLDELVRRLDDRSAGACVEKHARFDPVLLGHEDLARSPGDARVRAVALASRGGDVGKLQRLAAGPEHALALLGTADAFEVAHLRRVEREFGPYDGRLRDPLAIESIRRSFGPDHSFSPSQLETFALCPFQFYQRYVLGLKRVDERQELDEDYAGRGTDVHDVLERVHQQAAGEEASNLLERLNVLIETQVAVDLEPYEVPSASVPEVLKEIGDRRTSKALTRYVHQFRAYVNFESTEPTPHRFEVAFGQEGGGGLTSPLPHLMIGEGVERVKLQGKIDRIDLVRKDGKVYFRVVDYKTGSNPSGKDVLSGLASQLPLYAMAVEQLIFPEGDREFGDAGYWSLPKDGYKAVKFKEWPAYRDLLMTFVIDLVSRLRDGDFPIESRKKECHKYCDYQAACRVKEVRFVGKTWADRPTLGGEG